VKETKAALKAIQADKVKGRIWNAATKAEREAATRRIYWELQRTYFEAYRKAAKQAKREARAALDRFAGNLGPDFVPHAKQLPNGKNHVEIEYTGSRRADFVAANKKVKLDETPDGWTWHHAEDMKTMYLVPYDLHKAVKHSGGVATYKHGSGVPKYGD
jgi:hypothetical protein